MAVYVPYIAHSLNLYAVFVRHHHALIQLCSLHSFKTYTSSSQPHRWNALKEVLGENTKLDSTRTLLPKRLSGTRWSYRADALRSQEQNNISISLVLINLAVTNSRQVKHGVRLFLSWRNSISSKRHLWPSSGTQYWFVWLRPASFFRLHQCGALSGLTLLK